MVVGCLMPPRKLRVGATYRSKRHTGLWRRLLRIEGDTVHFETNWADTLTVTTCSLRSFAAWATEEVNGPVPVLYPSSDRVC
jgi:hypothetical protein